MRESLHSRVLARVTGLFDSALIQNNLRGLYMEHVVAEILGKDWSVVGQDWASWDLEHRDGTRIEVKQSAARQTWSAEQSPLHTARFSIRKPQLTYAGNVSTDCTDRPSKIFIFAWNGTADETADHRDKRQWQFFVLSREDLPDQKSIGLSGLQQRTEPVAADRLGVAVEALRIGGQG